CVCFITGYGNIYPVTTPGRVITIIYAFIGIPLALISLIALGSLFARICKILWTIILTSLKTSTGIVSKDLERQVDKLSKVTNSPKKEASDETDLLSFPVSFLIGLTFLWVFVCAALFLTVEDQWNYGKYFSSFLPKNVIEKPWYLGTLSVLVTGDYMTITLSVAVTASSKSLICGKCHRNVNFMTNNSS
uniref:Potassium channel domain-containing protein n=1 Tax=Parascaris equorum TaxID=6256 RepID=A0A914RS82_PAREQ